MDATHIPDNLTDIDLQIAALERDIEAKRAGLAALRAKRSNRGERLALARVIDALQAKHEQLVRQVQWATVGAAKPGEVL